jgi:archaellum biogenesis protein FlaJ (TadC family)
MIQIVLPIPEMVTSALFAAGVVLFIGWEEKIMDKMITDQSNSVEAIGTILNINNPNIDNKEYLVFSIVTVALIIYGLLLAVLFDSMGIHE